MFDWKVEDLKLINDKMYIISSLPFWAGLFFLSKIY